MNYYENFQSLLGCNRKKIITEFIDNTKLSIPFGMQPQHTDEDEDVRMDNFQSLLGCNIFIHLILIRRNCFQSLLGCNWLYESSVTYIFSSPFNPFWDATVVNVNATFINLHPFNPFWDATKQKERERKREERLSIPFGMQLRFVRCYCGPVYFSFNPFWDATYSRNRRVTHEKRSFQSLLGCNLI